MSLDTSIMKWTKKYLVIADHSIYIHGHRRVGFDAARELKLTPNTMLFSTTLKSHSFEVVLFSGSLHLAAATPSEKQEWMWILSKLIPKSSYDLNDPLQSASFERGMNEYSVEFNSTKDPGIILERRGNWAVASVVSDYLSRKVSHGSVLASIDDEQVTLTGFDSVLGKLSMWKAPMKLSFWLPPQKMGWLSMMVSVSRKTWKSAEVSSWGEFDTNRALLFCCAFISHVSIAASSRTCLCYCFYWHFDSLRRSQRRQEQKTRDGSLWICYRSHCR